MTEFEIGIPYIKFSQGLAPAWLVWLSLFCNKTDLWYWWKPPERNVTRQDIHYSAEYGHKLMALSAYLKRREVKKKITIIANNVQLLAPNWTLLIHQSIKVQNTPSYFLDLITNFEMI